MNDIPKQKRVLLIVGGGIAAYKVLDLCRLLRRKDILVRAILTESGAKFVTPLSLGSVTGDKVYGDLFSLTDEADMGHIHLSRDADLVVVAPATANIIAKMAHGMASDLATTALLATDKKVLLAPAMNVRMWAHPATQRNIAQLAKDGISFVGPNAGSMACGEYGVGRLAEPAEMLAAIERMLAEETTIALPEGAWADTAHTGARPLTGRHIVITSGPTHEPIDPVRFIANRSSGKQGHAIATAAAAGAKVTLISGPVTIGDPMGVSVVHVETAREMHAAVEKALQTPQPADVFVGAAAVADWRMADTAAHKLKKSSSDTPELVLTENPDILASVSQRTEGRPRLVIGFAAETQDVVAHAKAKLVRKGCDMIIANDVSTSGATAGGVFGQNSNTVHVVTSDGVEAWETMTKTRVAEALVRKLVDHLKTGEGFAS
jgi:phosphopantothenoylcysteine decarboxylase / phosphopantothenate---cysteine ligase